MLTLGSTTICEENGIWQKKHYDADVARQSLSTINRSPTDLKNPLLWGIACKELSYTMSCTSRV